MSSLQRNKACGWKKILTMREDTSDTGEEVKNMEGRDRIGI
jgi:hypothetical protein